MMKSSISILAAALAAVTTCSAASVKRQGEDFCGQWDTAEVGNYIIYNNLWGMDSATDGSQCTGVDSVGDDGSVAWHTSWSWSGGQYNVKSYANANLKFDPVAVSQLNSVPTSWSWSYSGDGLVCNVAYDMFLSSTADGDAEYEIMIWLGALGGAGPISESGSTIANPQLAGSSWDLYYGHNGQMQVYSFVAGNQVTNWSADIMEFISYLVSEQGLSDSQILQSAQGGTEPFVGSNAVFTVPSFKLAVE